MPSINAAVEAISVKEMPEVDRYGNTHRANLKIGDDWFSYGAVKKPEINIKTGDSWTQLEKGMEVEFMYDVNGDWKNIKKKTFSITNTTSSAPASNPRPQGKPQATQGNSGSFVNPATVGACLNLAIEVLGYKKEDFEDEEKVKSAIAWHKGTFDRMMALYADVEPAKSREEELPEEEDMYDDSEV